MQKPLRIGCHLSSSSGYLAMGRAALALGANTFAFFTRNPRGGSVKPFDAKDAEEYVAFASAHDIKNPVAHAPYTLNACSNKAHLRDFAANTMADDLERLEHIEGAYYNFHPGSHVGAGVEAGIRMIAEVLNSVLTPSLHTVVLLEGMAGKGSEVGSRFEELCEIMDATAQNDKLGVCLDTCHMYDAGYDIVNDLDGVLTLFDKTVGLERLCALHLNDSKNPFSSHKDRHEKIGEGSIGESAFSGIISHPVLCNLPMILETPNDDAGYAAEIKLLRGLREAQLFETENS